MKKMLAILGSISMFSAVAPAIFINENELKNNSELNNITYINEPIKNENYMSPILKAENSWSEVGIKNSVETDKTGTDDSEDTKLATKATAKIDWNDTISKSEFVVAEGYFAFHTYRDALYYSQVQLNLDKEHSTENNRIWTYTKTHEDWFGWSHHTSRIDLTLAAAYNEDEGITSLALTSYVYARTAGAVHSCSTTNNVDKIRFLVG